MNIVTKLSRQNIKHNKSWSFFTILGIMLATAMITAVITICTSFYQMIVNERIERFGTHQVVLTNLSKEGYDYLNQQDNLAVANVLETGLYLGVPQTYENQETGEQVYGINVYNVMNFDQNHHDLVSLTEGRYPENNNEVMLSGWIVDRMREQGIEVEVGKSLTLETSKKVQIADNGEYSLVDSQELTYQLVGIIKDEYVDMKFDEVYLKGQVYTIDQSPLEYTVVFDYNQLNSSIIDDAQQIYDTYKNERTRLVFNENYLEVIGITNSQYRLNMMASVGTAGGVVIALILVAGISLIRNAFAMAAAQRVKQLGMLSSVGATKQQKRYILYGEGLYLAVIGISLGILAGYVGMATTFSILSANNELFRELKLQVYIPWFAIALVVIFASLMVFLSLRKPAAQASKITPIESIREMETYKAEKRKIKPSKLIQTIFGFEGEVARKYMVRNKKKYRPTLISLTISIILFLVAMNFSGMMQQTLDLNVSEGADLVAYGSNFEDDTALNDFINQSRESSYFSQVLYHRDIYSEMIFVDGGLDETYAESLGLEGENYTSAKIYALDHDSYQKLLSLNGIANDAKYVFSDMYFKIEQGKAFSGRMTTLTSGDRVSILPYTGETDNGQGTEIFLTERVDQLIVGLDSLRDGNQVEIFTSMNYINEQFSYNFENYDGSGFLFSLNNLKDDQQAQEYLESEMDGTHIYNAVDNSRKSQQAITIVTVFVTGFISLISLICIVNIINTMSNNIRSRRKEFAILKSVGMDRHGINKMLYFEALMYGVKAIFYSVPISLALNYFIYQEMNKTITIGYGIGVEYYFVVIALVMGIVLLTMIYVSRMIKRQNIIETIKDESI